MEVKIVAFGIAADILKTRETTLAVEENSTVADLKKQLCASYPDFSRLASLSLAIGQEYREDDYAILPNQEVVIIPPVAGG